jgi:hypothetical protein
MPRVLSPAEVQQLGLDQPAQGPRVLSPQEVQQLGLDQDGPSAIGSFVDGVGQGGTLGFGDEMEAGWKAIAKKLLPKSLGGTDKSLSDQYREDRDIARARLEASRKANPGSYFAGNVTGGLAPMLIPGVGEAGALNVLGTGLGLGAANGLGTSTADLTSGDPAQYKQALGDTAVGGLAGTAGAVAGLGVGKALAPVANKLGEAANSLAARTLRGTATQYRNLGREGIQDVGSNLLDQGAVRFGDSPARVAERVADLETQTGQQLGKTIGDLDATTAPAYRAGIYGAQPNGVIPMYWQSGGVSKTQLAMRMMNEADSILQREGPAAMPIANKLRAASEDIANFPGPDRMPFAQAEQFKTAYAKLARFDKLRNTAPEQGAAEVAGVFRQGVEDEAAKAAAQANDPELAQQFIAAKKASGLAQKAGDLAEGADARAMARNQVSPSATALQLGGVLSGHPISGVVGGLAYNQVKQRLPASLAVAARGTSNLLQKIVTTQPGRLGVYGSILQRALATGGQQAYDSHAFVLSQTDPKFQELSQKVASEGDGGN